MLIADHRNKSTEACASYLRRTSPSCHLNHFSRLPQVSSRSALTPPLMHLYPTNPRLTHLRQKDSPPHTRRAQSILRQRTNLPIMAKLHRNPRSAGNRNVKFRRSTSIHLRLSLYDRCNGHDDIRAVYVSLACEEYSNERSGWIR